MPVSTLAASGCGAVASPAALRTSKLRRGNNPRTIAAPLPASASDQPSTTTQSPTVGRRLGRGIVDRRAGVEHAHPATRIRLRARRVLDAQDAVELDWHAGLLEHLAHGRVRERFARLDAPARDRPRRAVLLLLRQQE